MEILHLRYFRAVAEERNFARAAARLRMAASPLSRRVKDLEHELGTDLFIRSHHRIELTPAGEALLPLAVDLVDRLDALPRRLREAVGAPSRRASIGIAPDVSAELRDRFLAALASDHPDITPELVPASTEPLLRELRSGRIDLALVHGAVRGPDLRSVRLATLPVGVAVGRRTELGGRDSIRMAELAHLPYASVRHDSAPLIYQGIDTWLNRLGIHKRTILPSDNFAGVVHLVATGQAFALVSKGGGATQRVFHGEPVTILDIDDAKATISVVAAWRGSQAATNSTVTDLVRTVEALAPRGRNTG